MIYFLALLYLICLWIEHSICLVIPTSDQGSYAFTTSPSLITPGSNSSVSFLQNSTYQLPTPKGGYKTHECTDEQDSHLKEVIDLAREAVIPAIEEVDSDAPASNIFEAFLGPKGPLSELASELLERIRDFKGVIGRRPYAWTAKPPEFFCVTKTTLARHEELAPLDPWVYCQQRMDSWAFGSKKFRYIMICPRFWEHEVQPPPDRRRGEACPRVNSDNTWVDEDAKNLIEWQKYLMIHELLHLYLYDGGLADETDPQEVYGMNECTKLPKADDRIRNPNNLEYFVAMKNELCTKTVNPYMAPYHRDPNNELNSALLSSDNASSNITSTGGNIDINVSDKAAGSKDRAIVTGLYDDVKGDMSTHAIRVQGSGLTFAGGTQKRDSSPDNDAI